MATTRRFLLVRESRVAGLNAWLLNHATLDVRGGGDKTFGGVKLALLTDPTDGSVVRVRGANWKLPEAWWTIIQTKATELGLKVNSTDADNDLSHYNAANWTAAQVLADTTRKPVALKRVGVTA